MPRRCHQRSASVPNCYVWMKVLAPGAWSKYCARMSGMKVPRIKLPLIPLAGLVLCVAWGVVPTAQIPPIPQHNLPLDPAHDRGASITPAYEGWFQNQDGSFSLLVGYFNRNTKEPIDIPVGPNNKVEPGDPDQGQPTHFE